MGFSVRPGPEQRDQTPEDNREDVRDMILDQKAQDLIDTLEIFRRNATDERKIIIKIWMICFFPLNKIEIIPFLFKHWLLGTYTSAT